MTDYKRNQYSIALNGQGYILKGTPSRISRIQQQSPIYENRFASGDRGFGDFSYRWFWAQDSFVGMKDEKWVDDGMVRYTTGIDLSQQTNIDPLVALQSQTLATLSSSSYSDILCGLYHAPYTSSPVYLGTKGLSTTKPDVLYSTDGVTWTPCTNGSTLFDNNTGITSLASALPMNMNTTAKGPTATGHIDNAWTDPTYAYTEDGSVATAPESASQDYYNFGFSIPNNATILGIEIKVKSMGTFVTSHMTPSVSYDMGTHYVSFPEMTFTTSTSWQTSGSSTYLDDRSWTVSEFSNSNFLLKLYIIEDPTDDAKQWVDAITVNIYYKASTVWGATNGNNTAFFNIDDTNAITNQTTDIISETCVNGRLVKIINNILYAIYDGSDTMYCKTYTAGSWNAAFSLGYQSLLGGDFEYYPNDGKYYLLTKDMYKNTAGLYQWSGSGTPSPVYTWDGFVPGEYYSSGHSLKVYNNKLFILLKDITTSNTIVYSLNSSGTLSKEYTAPTVSESTYDALRTNYQHGFIVHNALLWMTGAITDGTYWWGSYLGSAYGFAPLFTATLSGESQFYMFGTLNYGTNNALKVERLNKTSSLTNSAYIETNAFTASLPNLNKSYFTCTLNFATLTSGQSIQVYYSIGGSFTSLGTISYAVNGAINTYTLTFPDNTNSKELILRFKLDEYNTTPYNYTVSYLPLPDMKYRWTLTVILMDNLILLDGTSKEPKRAETLRNVLKNDYYTKNALSFQDIDYVETTITDNPLSVNATTINIVNSVNFPEQGRVIIDNEEILYTGKTSTTLTGCSRGVRGTLATSHTTGSKLHNGYNVLISDYYEETPIGAKSVVEEAIVTLKLSEI